MKNVVLIGFMGTGKTSVGRLLAARLGCAFHDLDKKIEAQCGMTIPAMFEQHGEPYFRAREKEAVRDAAGRTNLVIATGGGTVKDAENVALLRQNGILVACGEGALCLLALQKAGAKRLSAAQFLAGTPVARGAVFSSPALS